MTPAEGRRLAKMLTLLGSPEEGEVLAAVRGIGRTLAGAGMDWHSLAGLIEAEARRRAAPLITFATAGPRGARKLMAHLARQPGTTAEERGRLERLRLGLLRDPCPGLSGDDVAWLDGLRHRTGGELPA